MASFAYQLQGEDHLLLSAVAETGPTAADPAGKGKQRKRGSGVKLSTDPQSVAARERRHRISHRFKILQSLVPGGSKMDTVSMLEEAIHYVKFLQAQIILHQSAVASATPLVAPPPAAAAVFFPSDYEGAYFTGGVSPDAGASPEFPPPPQGFNYSLPPLPPLPGRPSCTFPEEEHLFPWASSVNHYSL